MKKLLLFISVLALILGITAFTVSAETKSLLPTDVTKWKSVAAGGENAKAEIKDGATVVSGSVQSWPNVSYSMAANEHITVPIKGYAIEYEFEVDKGQTNIVIYMKGDTPSSDASGKNFQFPNCINTPNKDPGSGDVKAGVYKGVITIEDMMKTANFPAGCANDDNTITFSGLTIYSVAGANVTVKKFQVIQADKSSSGSDSSTTSSITSGSTSSENSSAAPSSESKPDSSSASSSSPGNTASSKVSSVSDTASTVEETPDSTWYYIVGGIAVVAIIATVVVIMIRKKK